MEKMTDLQDLLKHEIKDLYSAEEQIIAAMPGMIEKVTNPQLREALEMHLQVTQGQLERLQQVQQLMAQGNQQESGNEGEEESGGNNGLFARLMRRRNQGGETGTGGEKCLGMEGLLREGEKVMAEDMEPSVLDAAIVACAQKIEHYEICGYGTARAYARELNLGEVAELLEQTLDEEYEADDRLTDMAVGRLNEEAQRGGSTSRNINRSSPAASTSRSNGRATATKSTARKSAGAAVAASNSRGGSTSGRGASTGRGAASSASGRGAASTKTAATKTSGRSGSSPAPTGKASASRSASKSTGRGESSSKTRTSAASPSGKVPSKAAAAKGGRNSSGGGRTTASKSTGRGSSSGRSSGRK
jgi:ferritin-like metal-binding protein YciE